MTTPKSLTLQSVNQIICLLNNNNTSTCNSNDGEQESKAQQLP